MAVLLAAGAMLPLTVLSGTGLSRISKPEAALELVWLGLVLGSLMSVSGANWPGRSSEIAVPITILALAVITGKSEKGERTCSTLFWIAAIPAVLIIAVVTGKAEPGWLDPKPASWSGGLIAALLYPSLNGVKQESGIKTTASVGLTAGILALVIQGGLGFQTASAEKSPLYELGRCIGNGGFEILISVLLTLSWYGFAVHGMNASQSFGKQIGLTETQSRVWTGISASAIIVAGGLQQDWVLIAGSLIMWVLVPILHPKK